jgi:hypothetical protein
MDDLSWELIEDRLRTLVLPTFGVALAVMLVGRLIGGRRLAPLAAALALVAGVVAGNHFRQGEIISWWLDDAPPPHVGQLLGMIGRTLEGTASQAEEVVAGQHLRVPASRFWLPYLAAVAMLVELIAAWSTNLAGPLWAMRMAFAVFAARMLTPPDMRISLPAVPWALSAVIFFQWAVLTSLARNWQSSSVPCIAAVCAIAAAIVILHAHSARLAETALLLGLSLFAVATVSCALSCDTSPVVAAAAVFIPGLLLSAFDETFSSVPVTSFALAACAPLALAITLAVGGRTTGWKRPALVLVLPGVVAALAVVLAAASESAAL